ncbi:MAG: helix-turn-helix domain-containing protein, partial [Patescibacteria group bacterium]
MPDHPPSRGTLLKLIERALDEGRPKEVAERLQWFLFYSEQRAVSAVCRHFNIARSTFYRWHGRFDPDDLSSLEDHPTTPFSSAHKHINKSIEQSKVSDDISAQGKKHFLISPHTSLAMLLALLLINIGVLLFVLPTLAAAASAWNPTLLVNTEAFQIIDDDDTDSDVSIRFGDTIGEELRYVRAINRFDLTRDLRVSGNMTATGAISASGSVIAEGTLSGAALHVSGESTMSGSISVEGAAKFGSTIELNNVTYTFPPSDGASSGWVLKTDAAGTLSWAADTDTTLSTTDLDARYVNTSGDTMTGSLDVSATASGWVIHAQDEMTASGTLSVEGAATFRTATDSTTGFQVLDSDGGTPILNVDTTNERVGIGTAGPQTDLQIINTTQGDLLRAGYDTNNYLALGYNAGGLTTGWIVGSSYNNNAARFGVRMKGNADSDEKFTILGSGNVGIGDTTPETKLEVIGTASGRILHAQDELTSSGSVTIEEGNTLRINGVTYTFPPSDGTTSGWVLKTDAAGTLSWAAETSSVSQTEADDRYVNVSGDTMTGALLITVGGDKTHTADASLEVHGTMSGRRLSVTPSIASETGAVFVDVDVNGTGILLDSEATSAPGIAIDMKGVTGATPHILFGYNGTFDANLYRSAADRLYTDDSLYVRQTASGHTVHAETTLSSSGTLSVEGASSLQGAVTLGSTIAINDVTYTFPPSDGVSSGWVLKTDSAGTLSWAADTDTDTQSSTGALQSVFDNRYVRTAGDTMTGDLVLQSANLTATGVIV